MKHYKQLLFILFVLGSVTAYAQDVKVNYSKGNSLLFFDLESKSKLSSSIGLSLHNKKYAFELSYINTDFSYGKKISNIDQLPLNYNNQIHTLNLAYDIELGYIEKVKLDFGFNLSVSTFEINANLKNSQGLHYSDYSFEELSTLGYFSEDNFESSLSDLNLDQLEEYPTSFFSFGPALSCSYEIVENFEISAKTVYRKNMTDLLDNINVNNTRDITANSQDDNQLDFYLGIKFNLSRNKSIDNDNLVNYIYSIIEEDVVSEDLVINEDLDSTSVKTSELIIEQEDDINIITKNEYILNLFDVDTMLVEEQVVDQIVNDNDENSFAEEAEEEIEDDIISYDDSAPNTLTEASSQSYYVIVGVFSEKENLKTLAASLDIDSSNYFIQNQLHYLYALSTKELSEARQLRDSLSIESWIYY